VLWRLIYPGSVSACRQLLIEEMNCIEGYPFENSLPCNE